MICDKDPSSANYGANSAELINIARAIIFETNLENALKRVAKAGKELTNANMCNVGLIGEKYWDEMHFFPDSYNKMGTQYSVSDGIMGWVAKNKKCYYISNIKNQENLNRYIECRKGTTSELAVPILHGNDCLGVLNIESDNIDAFNEEHCNILKALADFVAMAIINLRNDEELKAIQEIEKELVSSLDQNATLNHIWNKASELMGTKDIRIRLLEGDKLIPVIGVDKDQVEAATWKIGQCIVGRVAATGKPILEPDVQNNRYFKDALETIKDHKRLEDLERIQSEVAAPLIIQDKIIGVINVHSHNKNAFSKQDCSMLCALANGAAIAIENSRHNNILESLSQIDKKIADKKFATSVSPAQLKESLKETLNLIRDEVSKLVKTENIVIRQLDGNELIPLVGIDQDQIEFAKWELGQSIVGKVAENKEPQLVKDVQNNPDFIAALRTITNQKRIEDLKKIHSMTAVPLMFQGMLIGVINANKTQIDSISERDHMLLCTFAGQAAIAAGQLYLCESLSKNRDILKKIEVVGKYVTKVDVNEVLQEITKNLQEIIKVDIPLIYLLDEDNKFSNIIYGDIRTDWEELCKPRTGGAGCEAIRSNAVTVANENTQLDINPFPKRKGVKTTIALPIVIEGFKQIINGQSENEKEKKLGIMYMHFLGKKHELQKDELKKLKSIAKEIASIMEPLLTNLNLQDISGLEWLRKNINEQMEVKSIMSRIDEIAGADIILMYLYNGDKKEFGKLCYSSIGKSWKDKSMPRDNGVGKKALESGLFAFANDNKSPYLNPSAKDKGVKTTAAVPLIFGEKKLGVMYLHFLEDKIFSPEEIRIIQTFSSNAAIAIDKAYSLTKLKSLFKIGQKINENMDWKNVLLNIRNCGKEITHTGIIHIWLFDEPSGEWTIISTVADTELSPERSLAATKPRTDGIGHKVIKDGRARYIDATIEGSEASDSAKDQGIKSIAAFPLRMDKKIAGVIFFHFPTHNTFSDEEKLRLSLFSSQIESALNNSKQYQKLIDTKDELEKLKGVKDINPKLVIDPTELIDVISIDELDIDGISDKVVLTNEIKEVFQRLFWTATKIDISRMIDGYSGSKVVMVRPHYGEVRGKEVIVKLGGKKLIEEEEEKYNEHVKWFISGIRSAYLMASAYTPNLGGIVYSLVGNPMKPEEYFSFAQYYQLNNIDMIGSAISKLFEETCISWYRWRKNSVSCLIDEIYKDELPSKERLDAAWDEYFAKRFDNTEISFKEINNYFFPNPIQWVFNNTPKGHLDILTSITHGDLNGDNIILNKEGDAWLIDFYRTGWSYVLRDFIRLETTIKFELLSKDVSPKLYFELEEMLMSNEPDETNISKWNDDVKKAFDVINIIRQKANDTLGAVNFDINQYYIGLLSQTLKFLVFKNVNNRDFVLMSACMICNKLLRTGMFYTSKNVQP